MSEQDLLNNLSVTGVSCGLTVSEKWEGMSWILLLLLSHAAVSATGTVVCPGYCRQCCIQEYRLMRIPRRRILHCFYSLQVYQLFIYWIRSGIIKELYLDFLFIRQSCQSRKKIVFGDFRKVINFYNLFISIINIAAFFPDFKSINTKKYLIVKIIQFIWR